MIFKYLKVDDQKGMDGGDVGEALRWLPAKPAIARAIESARSDGLTSVVALVVEPYKERCWDCGSKNVMSSFDWYRKQPITWCLDCGRTRCERRRRESMPEHGANDLPPANRESWSSLR